MNANESLEAWFASLPDEYVRVPIPNANDGFVYCASKTLKSGHPARQTCDICRDVIADVIDTTNDAAIAVRASDNSILMLNPPRFPMSKETALRVAAWLVVMADDEERFAKILAAVKNT